MSQRKIFFEQFKQDFFHMGAVLPSSRALARAMAAYLARRQPEPVRVLEVGAGTGAFTGEITAHLRPGDRFDIVEINPKLIAFLQQRFEQEAPFQTEGVDIRFINDDVRRLSAADHYNYIVFSLPLTNFPTAMVQEILDLMMSQLAPGGVFSYVKYIFLGRLKYLFSGSGDKAQMRANQQVIAAFADRYQIERRAVLANVPPAWTYYWQN